MILFSICPCQAKNTNPALTKFVECIQEEMPMSLKSISLQFAIINAIMALQV